jgi:hypothetical protein
MDRGVELLERVLNHAVPLGMLVDEEMFGRLFEASEEPLPPRVMPSRCTDGYALSRAAFPSPCPIEGIQPSPPRPLGQ